MAGPLSGITVIELQGRGPGPFGAMVLADLGAEVIRVARPSDVPPASEDDPATRLVRGHRTVDLLARGRRSVVVDLKTPAGVAAVLRLVDRADVLIEGYRPGVAERLGLGPETCLEQNPRLVYARMTGWGQRGPYAPTPGHDINYVALAGALALLGPPDRPPAPPLNLVGDFGGGGMLLAVGVLSALVERSTSGLGQVVDAAMVDGVALLTTLVHGLAAEGLWSARRGSNVLDGAAHFYNVYETADGRYVTVGSGEPQFYAELLERLGLDAEELGDQHDPAAWPRARERLAAVFSTRTRDEWCALLEGTDTCFAPVLGLDEAPAHPHNAARATFTEVDGVVQPSPAPRFDRTPAPPVRPPPPVGADTLEVLREHGFEPEEIDALLADGVAVQA